MGRLPLTVAVLAALLIAGPAAAQFSWPASKIAGNLDLGSGTIRGAVDVNTETIASVTIAAAEAYGTWHVANYAPPQGSPMPAAVAGLNFCNYSQLAQVLTLTPSTGDTITLDDTKLDASDEVDSPGEIGNLLCFLSHIDDEWVSLGRAGGWIDGGAPP